MITITERAATRIKAIQNRDKKDNLMLRLAVNAGGCSGFSYEFSYTERVEDDDHIFGQHGVEVVVDETSMPFIEGVTLDWVDDLIGASFKVTNPKASASCGCGTSFSI